uniref:Myosin motor domain-containing protein n=1 Tax=Panagrolaimus sp. ES5 TaxID=591445 RepID=A0AC34G0V5_9BILA
VNACIPFSNSTGYIGVLDIAGFEFFQVNSFEQFCINYCNEKLQQFFNERILKHEQELYRREALNVPGIDYADNQDCIELFEQKASGLLDLLDEEARLPGASALHYTEAVHKANARHFRLDAPRKSRLREHRDMRDNEGFLIRHYAGAVCYQTAQFLEKNNDALHASLKILMEQSENSYLKDLFEATTSGPPTPARATPGRSGTQKLAAVSVGSKFRSQLNVLLEKLRSAGTHFVRCLKPNSEMSPAKFEGAQILSQLKCAGMGSVLRLMHCGFPSRASFTDLYEMYQSLLPEQLKRLDARLFCKCLFHALGLSETDFQFGLTKAFFRAGKFAEFDELMHQDEAHMTALVGKVHSWLIRMRWRKVQYTALTTIRVKNIIAQRKRKIAKVQSYVRGYLVRKHITKKLQSFRKLNSLALRFGEIKSLCVDIDESKKDEYEARINQMIDTASALTFEYQIVAEEQARLEAIEAETLRQRQLAEQEERERQEKEAKLAEVREFEARLQREAEEAKVREAEFEAQRKEKQEKEAQEALKRESERLDGELAQRLAHENKDVVLEGNQKELRAVGENDLSKYTHSELREMMNNATDIEWVRACQSEFHRRMHFFNGWRFKAAPSKLLARPVGKSKTPPLLPLILPKTVERKQRYFRAPLSNRKRGASSSSPEKGFWFTHFDGEFIVREIELKPRVTPILFLAGRDDLKMSQYLLSETGLIETQYEIKEREFEATWLRFGGPALRTRD